jgi:hypothetical protein
MMLGRRNSNTFQTLWIGSRLSVLERLSLTSFAQNGHTVHLYVYDDVEGVPEGVLCRDARRIVAEDCIFRYGPEADAAAGSLAGFANMFRYKLLLDRGGWWFDTDIVCLRRVDVREAYCFAFEDDVSINNGFLRAPKGSPLMKVLYETAAAKGTKLKFGETGPTLLTEVVTGSDYERFVLPREAVYPIWYTEWAKAFDEDPGDIYWNQLDGAYTVHLWNEFLRQQRIDKDGEFPPTSVFERLKRRYGIESLPSGLATP